MQYFRKGLEVVARNLNLLVCKMKVVIFQLIKNTPIVIPTNAVLKAFTLPIYSGTKNKESAPKFSRKPLLIVLVKIAHITNNI
jgi:hypothetical protein